MAISFYDRVKETSATTGLASIALGGAVTQFRSFASVYSNAVQSYYCAADQSGPNWEVGIGTYLSSGNVLGRTSILASSNSGNIVNFTSGSLFVFNTIPAISAPNSIAGSGRNIVVRQASTTTATVTADEFIVENSLGSGAVKLANINLTLNAGTNGANGLDTGALAATQFYWVYIIYNPSSNTQAGLLQVASGSPPTVYSGAHMPSGYQMSALVGILATNGSSQFIVTTQIDREVFYQSAQVVFSNQANSTGFTAQTITQIPNGAKNASGYYDCAPILSTLLELGVAADATGTGAQYSNQTTSVVTGLSLLLLNFRQVPVITSQLLYILASDSTASPTNSLAIQSFTF